MTTSFKSWIKALRAPLGGKPVRQQSRRVDRNRQMPLTRLELEELEDRLPPAAGLTATNQALLASYGQIPLSFEANAGQTDTQVQYLAHGSGYALFLTSTGAVLSLQKTGTIGQVSNLSYANADALGANALGAGLLTPPTTVTGVALAMNLVGANPHASVAGLDQQPGTSNYFIGNDPSQWHTNIANYGQVAYQDVYPRVNLVYYGNQQQLEYDFVVAPRADPNSIRLNFQGADSMSLDDHGNLVLSTSSGDVLQHAPVIYQEVGGSRQAVAGHFVLLGQDEVGFQVGLHDASLPLTIDPVLSYSTYLGGNGFDAANGIAVDGSGNAYVTGHTDSTNFPTTTGAYKTSVGFADAFVAKLNSTGTALIYSTYLGGNYSDGADGIAVDGSGNAYVTGFTYSTNFPTTAGAFQTSFGGGNGQTDAFVTKLNATGTGLNYSTYLGGNNFDQGSGIAVDGSGNAYVTGFTYSTNFPTTAGAFQTSLGGGNGPTDAFVTKLNATGTGLNYSTYLGGNKSDAGSGIAVDGSGNAYVTGYTSSTNFPTTAGAFQTSLGGAIATNDFVTKLNAAGTALIYSTYLGGNNNEQGNASIAVDGSGDAYVTGLTFSTNFPTTAGAFQTSIAGVQNAFVTKLNATGTGLNYSTYLGGNNLDAGSGIAVDGSGNAYVTGLTYSTNFPTTAGAFQTSLGGAGATNAFVTKLNAAGSALSYSTYLGGNGNDQGNGIAVDASDNAYVTGFAGSTNFPTTAGAFQTSHASDGGSDDAFVTKFDFVETGTTTTVSTSNGTPVYGTGVTLTATVAPASGTTAPTLGSVTFFINGTTTLGTVSTATTDANHDSIFTYVTAAAQLKVAGGVAQPLTATYAAGTGFTGSSSTNTVTETVAKKTLTVTATPSDKVFDGTTAATVTLSDNKVAGDAVFDSSTSATFADANVGTGKTVTVTGISISGADAGNYSLSSTTATTTANITPSVTDAGNGVLSIALGANQSLSIASTGSSYIFSSSIVVTAPSSLSNDVIDFSGFGTPTLTLTSTGMARYINGGIDITDAGANATFTFKDSGSNTYANNIAVTLSNAAAGAISFNGSSKFGNYNLLASTTLDVLVNSGASITSAAGNLTLLANQNATTNNGGNARLAAAGPLAANSDEDYGIDIDGPVTTSHGNITLSGQSIHINGSVDGSTVTLLPGTDGTPIDLGGSELGSSGTLSLNSGDLNQISTATLSIGDVNSGPITVSNDINLATNTNVQLTSGGNVAISGGQVNTDGGTLLLHPGDSPAAVMVMPTYTGIAATASKASFGSDLAIDIEGPTVNTGIANTGYTPFRVNGTVDLSHAYLRLPGSYVPKPSDAFTIVQANSVIGTFANYAQGAEVTLTNVTNNGTHLIVHYTPTTVTLTVEAFAVKVLGGNTVIAGNSFLLTAQAVDQFGNPVSGPTSVLTTTVAPADPQGNFPINVPLKSGFGYFLGTLKTAGSYTLPTTDLAGNYTGTSVTITVAPAAARYFTVAVPTTATTGSPVNVTVTALDSYGNVSTGYTGTVHFASSDANAGLPSDYTFVAADNGSHTFPTVLLNTAGSQTITATDTKAARPIITGTSAAIVVSGLQVLPGAAGFTPTPTGFIITFNKPFLPADVTMYGVGQTPQDVTLIGDKNGSITGTLLFDPTDTIVTFKASASPLDNINSFVNGGQHSVVLPDDHYTVTIKSGTGSGTSANGFFDQMNAPLDGTSNNSHANYITTFNTTYQSAATPVLAIPDFARGPDDNSTIKLPNDTAHGIPITLYNAVNVTDVMFTLTFNPALLSVTGASSADATGGESLTLVSSTPTTATFHYTHSVAQSGIVVLGDILANDPSASKTSYGVKELLTLGNVTVNGATFTGVTAPGIHANAYLGDVSGDGVIGAADVNPVFTTAIGSSTGFGPYSLLDPTIVGDVTGDGAIDGSDVAYLKAYILNHASRAKIPVPPGLSGIVSPSAVDPMLSLAAFQTARGIVNVPVLVDHPHPEGSNGLTEAILALTYDPSVLSVSANDITLGSLSGLDAGWQFNTVVDQSTGQIGIEMYSMTPITSLQGGSLVNIAFHVQPNTSVPTTCVQLVNSVNPNGQQFGTVLADTQGGLIVSRGMDRLLVETGATAVSLAAPTNTDTLESVVVTNRQGLTQGAAEETAPSPLGFEANEVIAVMSKGAVAGETAAVHMPAGLVVTDALVFQTNAALVAATQLASQVFQIGNLPQANTLLTETIPQQLADRPYLTKWTDAPADLDPLNLPQDSLDKLIWESAAPLLDWLAAPSQSSKVRAQTDQSAETPFRQAADLQAVSDRIAVLDKVFGRPADNMDDFRDLGDY